jgi:hypothetical protein
VALNTRRARAMSAAEGAGVLCASAAETAETAVTRKAAARRRMVDKAGSGEERVERDT